MQQISVPTPSNPPTLAKRAPTKPPPAKPRINVADSVSLAPRTHSERLRQGHHGGQFNIGGWRGSDRIEQSWFHEVPPMTDIGVGVLIP